jgi:hypothetical protein
MYSSARQVTAFGVTLVVVAETPASAGADHGVPCIAAFGEP